MKTFLTLTKRNIKMFFSDKGMFFSSMITPIILLVLYTTFLGSVYSNSFTDALQENGIDVNLFKDIIDGTVYGQLLSALLAVSCITVSFCSNLIVVQDKYKGVRRDFMVSPVKKSTLALSYYFGTLAITLIITFTATFVGFALIALKGAWYMSFADVLLVLLDVLLLTVFGTAISSVASIFITTQGQSSAIGTIVSAGYGFICGAYMPISQFPGGLQKFLSFLPGTYGTSLIKEHCLRGVFEEFANKMPDTAPVEEIVNGMKKTIDCNVYFFDNLVDESAKYIILATSIVVLIAAYIVINVLRGKKNK